MKQEDNLIKFDELESEKEEETSAPENNEENIEENLEDSSENKEEKEDLELESKKEPRLKKKKKPLTEEELEQKALKDQQKVLEEMRKKALLDVKEERKAELRKQKAIRDREKAIEKSHKKAESIALKRSKKISNAERFEVDTNEGLTKEQIDQRIAEGFANYHPKKNTKSIPRILFTNIFTFFNILTYGIAGWLISVKAFSDLVFVLMVTANLVIGIYQEIKAKKTIDKLSLISSPTARVLRDGKELEIKIEEVVLDDIIFFDSGKQICSDSIVVDGSIEVNESLLTGESDSIIKKPGDVLFSGSYVVAGSCKAKVDKVGKDNYIESLTQSAKQYVKPKSEILKSLNLLITVMAVVIIILGALLFWVQCFKNGMNYPLAVSKTAGAMIGMIPSGLYLCTSVGLAIGVMRLAKNNVLVQELYCIEMLARIDVLCLDKTGTITDGSMKVKDTIEYNQIQGLNTKLIISGLLNAIGDSNLTSQALEQKFGRGKRFKSIGIIPFSSKRKFSAATFDGIGTFVMGAPEIVMKNNFDLIKKDVDKYSKEGFRTLVLAHINGNIQANELPNALPTPVSLILIEDNIRPDAIETINYFKSTGVSVKVISGDNPQTVAKIAERAGVPDADQFISLAGLTDNEVIHAATKYSVFGRVSPSQKKLLVQTLKEAGKTVAMTGDGVNDILALREADCSIAIASGSEAARNVSHLVLLDSNFSSMPKVVSEGRRVINNITKVARLYLTKTIFSLLLAIEALINGVYPITPSQLFIIDLFCIGIPSFVLVLEKNNKIAKGHFLPNVIKGALPGAIVILIESIVVFALSDAMDMSNRTLSTIIVIETTFTCFLVLFDVCKPWNMVHKILVTVDFSCSVFLILFSPKFFKFAPIISVGEYYDESEEVKNYEVPTISISQDGYYTIDGYVIDEICRVDTTSHNYSINTDGKLIIDKVITNYTPSLPEISKSSLGYYIDDSKVGHILSDSQTGYFAIGGFKTSIPFVDGEEDVITIDSETGKVYAYSLDTGYSIMPSVEISNGYYVVNKHITTVSAKKDTVGKVTLDGVKVLVDGSYIYSLYDYNLPYSVSKDNLIVVDSNYTKVEYTGFDNANITLLENTEYSINGVKTGVNYNVQISTTQAGYYIVNGYITTYSCNNNRETTTTSLSNDGYLKINGKKTNIKLDYTISKNGGNVQNLPLNAIILLLMLCFASAPLMKVMRAFVPVSKKFIRLIIEEINKL